jgi:ubiquinone/menaquinone biosynthesis C-methylase UbiE
MVNPVAEGYDAVYGAWSSSPAFHEIWARHAVLGEMDRGFEHLNFAPRDQMRRIAAELRLAPGGHVVDIACGAGGPGLWVARDRHAQLVGIDLSSVGTRLAVARAKSLGLTGANFIVSSATHTGLAGDCFDGAMSVDSLQYLPDKRVALAEIARILAPSGRLVFTAFELDAPRVAGLPVLGDDPVEDYGPLLLGAGFVVDTYEETPEWETRLEDAYAAVVAAEPTLRPELGDAAIDALILEMSLTLSVRPYRRRVFVSAHRPSP